MRAPSSGDPEMLSKEKDIVHGPVRHTTTSSSSLAHSEKKDDDNSAEEPSEQNEPPNPVRPPLGRATSKKSTTSTRSIIHALDRVLTTRSIQDPGPPPDGGLKAWTQVACGFLTIFCTWGWNNAYGAFQTYYTLNLNKTPSTISWIGTVQTFLTFAVSAFSGRLLDAGLFLPTFFVGAVLQVLGIFFMSLSTKFWQLMLTQGILTGLGGGIFFAPSMGLVATYFSSKRALALGIVTSGTATGGMIYPVLVKELLPKIGFAWTARVLGFVNLAFLALVFAFIRPRLPPRKSGPMVDWTAWTEPAYVCLVLALYFDIWSIYYGFYYIGSFGVDVAHMTFEQSTNLIILVNGVGLPARLIPPYFADKYGQLNMMLPTVLFLLIVTFCWLAVTDSLGVYIFTVFYGIASGSFQCLIPSTVSKLTPSLDMVGTRLGMAFTFIGFAALTGSPIGGAIQAAQGGSYVGATLFAAGCTVVAAALIFTTRYIMSRGKIKIKV